MKKNAPAETAAEECFLNNDATIEIPPETNKVSLAYRSYKYRWVVLTLYVLCCFGSAFQWPHYTVIPNIVTEYYKVSNVAVTWTGLVFLFWYIVFVYPGTYLIEKLGLRTSVLIGSLGSSIGAWMKVASIKSDRFWVIILGQSVIALTQTFLISIPAAISATWFGPEQVAIACSIGTLGFQLGIAASYLTTPILIVYNTNDEAVIEEGLQRLALVYATVSSLIFLVTLIGFREKPLTPPSRAQLTAKQDSINIAQSVKRLLKSTTYMMFLLAYTFNIGIFLAICFLLHIILLSIYKDAPFDVGRIGTLFVFSGMIGCLLFGKILDRYRRFKLTALFLFVVSTITMLVFGLCIRQGIGVQYFIVAALGFFNNAVFPVGLEVAAEITYPEPISVPSGMLLISSKVFGIIFAHLYSFLLGNFIGILPHLAMSAIALLSSIIVFFTKFDLKRQEAETGQSIK